jgi:hypothetical protein
VCEMEKNAEFRDKSQQCLIGSKADLFGLNKPYVRDGHPQKLVFFFQFPKAIYFFTSDRKYKSVFIKIFVKCVKLYLKKIYLTS